MSGDATPALGFLVIEDEALLAMDLAGMIEDCGHGVVGEAASLAEVAALPTDLHAQCALVDVQLLHGSSGIDAACLLRQLWPEIALMFVTANPTRVPAGFEGAIGIVQKPFSHATLISAIDYLARWHCGAEAAGALPPNILPIGDRLPA